MKNEKAFTLAELLGVIIILVLVLFLVFPNVINQLKEGENSISSAVEQLIFNSAGNYIDNNLNEYPISEDTTYCISLEELVRHGEITEGLLIDKKGKQLELSKKVEVTIQNQKKSFKMNDNCQK